MPVYEVITGPAPWPARYTFSPAVRAGNLLFISGMTAGDESGTIVGPGDIVAQTRYIFEKLAALLAAAGGGFEHIVQTTEYVTTTENYGKTAAVRREFFKGRFPTATGVIVAGLLREGALIEISAVAVLPDHTSPLLSGERAG
ncbi:MAG TPA: RidA family protein [Methylomirabilota bacterium]|jgi:enamine deaminase RidA (YjgF/YER057c/UK114 family)